MFATLAYNGHAHYDSDALQGWTGELGDARDPLVYGETRRRLRMVATPAQEAALKNRRTYGADIDLAALRAAPPPASYNHFGFIIVSCEGGDLRPTPTGVEIFADDERRFETLPTPAVARAEVIDELIAAVFDNRPPMHSGAWSMATTEICLAMLQSSTSQCEVALHHQVGL